MFTTLYKQTHFLYVKINVGTKGYPFPVGTDGLAAARSRSRSDTTPWYHSLRSRRFATSTARKNKGIFVCKNQRVKNRFALSVVGRGIDSRRYFIEISLRWVTDSRGRLSLQWKGRIRY